MKNKNGLKHKIETIKNNNINKNHNNEKIYHFFLDNHLTFM